MSVGSVPLGVGGESPTAKSAEEKKVDPVSSDRVLHDLIGRDFREHHIEYAGYLSNHMLHALVALQRLGGSFCFFVFFWET